MSFLNGLGKALGIAILLGSSALCATIDNSQIQPKVNTVGTSTTVTCDGFSPVVLGSGLSLPARTVLIAVEQSKARASLTSQVLESSIIGQVDRASMYSDLPTADQPREYMNVVSSPEQECLGQKPIQLIDYVTLEGQEYARVLFFPVTVDSLGSLVFNRRIDVNLDGSVLSSQHLLPVNLASSGYSARAYSPTQALSTTGPKYLIVTSGLLDSACQRLAAYKRETGYDARVELIGNITAGYPGRDDAERLRNRLKSFYVEGGEYVLLAGDETQLPIRYAYPSMTSTIPDMADLQVCDLYFADLTGDWDSDSDGVWGEKYADQADVTPELLLGRLPFSRPEEMTNYTNKLIAYETNPGDGNLDYLTRAFFFSSDQMRDYNNIGQHTTIAAAYPPRFAIDTSDGVELSHGSDSDPTNLPASDLLPILSSGFGIVNIIAHGRSDAFGVRTSGYNDWPKSYFMTTNPGGTNGDANELTPNGNISFYYSLACDNGGFDLDEAPISELNPNLVETLLGVADAGAVGFVAHSRWGWITSSHLVQKTFFDSLFAHPDRPAVLSMYDTKAVFYYYLDQVYGINYYGDPSLKVYTDRPHKLSISTIGMSGSLTVAVINESGPVAGASVILSCNGNPIAEGTTNPSGYVNLSSDMYEDSTYTFVALKSGSTTGYKTIHPSIVTGVNETNDQLPRDFNLAQNYPNPFNPSTTIGFDLPSRSKVVLDIYDVLGRRIKTLVDGEFAAGSYDIEWDGKTSAGAPVASGVYFYRIEAGDYASSRKMLLLK